MKGFKDTGGASPAKALAFKIYLPMIRPEKTEDFKSAEVAAPPI